MDGTLILNHCRRNGNYAVTAAVTAAGAVLILPADPNRFYIAHNGSTSAVVGLGFGETAPAGPLTWVPNGDGNASYTEDTLPMLITLPVWLFGTAASQTIRIWTVSYEASRRRILEEAIRHELSKLRTS